LRKLIESNEFLRAKIVRDRDVSDNSSHANTELGENTSLEHHQSNNQDTSEAISSETVHGNTPHVKDFAFNVDDCQSYESGDVIFRQGEPGSSMFIILEGNIEISQGSDGDKQILASMGPGDFFGEMAIITNQPRIAQATAVGHTVLLPIHQDTFLERIQAEPELALYILEGLIMRLRKMLMVLTSPEETIHTVAHSFPPPIQKKSRTKTAIISLATCGGCSATLLDNQELLLQLLEKIQISYCPMLIDKEEIGEVDVAIVDGIVRVKEDEEKLLETRQKCKYLIAWGSCSSFGGIPSYANHFELEDLLEQSYGQAKDPFAYYLSGSRGIDWATYQNQNGNLKLLRRAGKIDDFVKVDYYLPGCPPSVSLLNSFVNELRGESRQEKPKSIVCAECHRKPVKMPLEHFWVYPKQDWDSGHCFTSRGSLCMGFLTKGGCNAVCPNGGLPCWGCRGLSERAFKQMEAGNSFEEYMKNGLLKRHRDMEDQIKLVMKIFRKQGNTSLKFDRFFIRDRSRVR
jgi:F420-non-reducing hydrogenase small subunit